MRHHMGHEVFDSLSCFTIKHLQTDPSNPPQNIEQSSHKIVIQLDLQSMWGGFGDVWMRSDSKLIIFLLGLKILYFPYADRKSVV